MNSNLVIEKELLESMDKSLSLMTEEKWVLGVLKGEIDDKPPEIWTITILPEEMAYRMISEKEAAFVKIENRDMLVYPISLISELVNKILCWGEKEMELIASA